MFISIIIPVYNAEKYLSRCLDSIIESLEPFSGEILLVNNNSTDNSSEIIEKYKKKFPRLVKLLQCKKAGAAAARNFGAKHARGDYIWFIDADDRIDKDAIRKLLAETKQTNADILMFGATRVYRDGNENYLSPVSMNDKGYKSRFIRYGMGPWQIIIKRKWWARHGFEFHEGIIHEDMEMMSSLILFTDKLASIDEPLYFYYENADSVLHKEKWDPKYFDIFPALNGLYARFKRAGAEKKYHDELEWFFIWNLLIDSAKDFGKFKEGRSGFAMSRKILKKYFPNWRKNRFLRQKPLKLQLLVRLNYYK